MVAERGGFSGLGALRLNGPVTSTADAEMPIAVAIYPTILITTNLSLGEPSKEAPDKLIGAGRSDLDLQFGSYNNSTLMKTHYQDTGMLIVTSRSCCIALAGRMGCRNKG